MEDPTILRILRIPSIPRRMILSDEKIRAVFDDNALSSGKIEYVYIKPRSNFGKQCIFEESGPTVEENIVPDPELGRNYILRDYVHQEVQNTAQLALHEVQTKISPSKNNGMLHSEGGWPKEINPRDEEVTARFRRRVEKEDRWVEKMKLLLEPMDWYIQQNNAVNIYDYYFDDMIPTSLTLSYDIRTLNVYTDPHFKFRPVQNLSWSPSGNRLAAAYSFTEFQEAPPDVSPDSYIWDIENPNKALITLRPTSPTMSLEFNPRDPWMLISGLLSGQVCNWDTRIGDAPAQISHRQFSHRSPTTQTLWIASKTNSEFFSASADGTIKWWDTRNLKHPTDVIVMDLEDPQRADIVRAIGVSSLQFESTMGSKFMAGTDTGVVISGNRKGNTAAERIQLRFSGHTGPVLAIDRNPFNPKNFLTVGDWTAKIWAEDTREGHLLMTANEEYKFTGGCWSRSRFSVFFTVNTKGQLEIYDVMRGIHQPVISISLCDDILTAIRPHEDGQLLAVGSHRGGVYLVECSEGLTMSSDKVAVANYLDVCSRYAKACDSRLKEMRVLRVPSQYQYFSHLEAEPGDPKKGKGKKAGKDKAKTKQEEAAKEKEARKKVKGKKTKESSAVADDPRLVEIEKQFYAVVEAEMELYGSLDDLDKEQVTAVMQEIFGRARRTSDVKKDAAEAARQKKAEEKAKKRQLKLMKSLSKMSVRPASEPVLEKEESVVELDLVEEPPAKKPRKEKTVRICKTPVCQPEICCKDALAEKKRRATSESPSRSQDLCASLPHGGIVLTKDAMPDVLAEEVKGAKSYLRQWQTELRAGKRTFRLSEEDAIALAQLSRRSTSEERPSTQSRPSEKPLSIQEPQKEEAKDLDKDKEKVQWDKRMESTDSKLGVKSHGRRRRRSKKPSKTDEEEEVPRRPVIDWTVPTVRKILSRGSVMYPRISAAFIRGIDEDPEVGPQDAVPTTSEKEKEAK